MSAWVLDPNERDIIKARLIRRIKGVRSISDLSVAEADMSLAMTSDVIDIVLSHVQPIIEAEVRERVALAILDHSQVATSIKSTEPWQHATRRAARIARSTS